MLTSFTVSSISTQVYPEDDPSRKGHAIYVHVRSLGAEVYSAGFSLEIQRLRTLPPSMVWSLLFYKKKLINFHIDQGLVGEKVRDEVEDSFEGEISKSPQF